MTEKIIYVANDGMTFETKEACTTHEDGVASVIEAMRTIKNFCAFMKGSDCKYCPYYEHCDCSETLPPCEWELPDEDDTLEGVLYESII